ncbi:MAG: YceI family protein [Agriterribacter sp.]
MKTVITCILLLFVTAVWAQRYKPVNEGSEVKFKIKNFGVNISGSLAGLNGDITFFADSIAAASFDVTVDSKTINTGIDQRDEHLRKPEFFDTDKFPQLHFVSTKITTSTNKAYLYIFGKLTIKDVTKEISFPFKATPKGDDYLFEGEFTINRRDYNVGSGSITMADNLTVNLNVLAKKQ